MTHLRPSALLVFVIAAGSLIPARSQTTYYPDRELRVHDLPTITAKSHNPTSVLAASLETIIRDPEVCCGKDSALEDAIQTANPASLGDIAQKLQGRHLLSDGRPVIVTTEYLPIAGLNIGHLVYEMVRQHPALLIWNSHIYVVHGIVYTEGVDTSTNTVLYSLKRFLLFDTRYSDAQRETFFDRESDDLSKIQGILFLSFDLQ